MRNMEKNIIKMKNIVCIKMCKSKTQVSILYIKVQICKKKKNYFFIKIINKN